MSESTYAVILVVSGDSNPYGIPALLVEKEYRLFSAESISQACRFLVERQVDLVVVDYAINRGEGADAVRELRRTSSVSMYPIIVVGRDDAQGTITEEVFDAGADDFIAAPFPEPVLLARLRYQLDSVRRLQAVSSISAQASSAELALILQFLEAEKKSGRMIVKRQNWRGEIRLVNGKMAKAEARDFSGLEAIVEMLSWSQSAATFIEDREPAEPSDSDRGISDVITQAIAKVASFRAAQRRLPPAETVFITGAKDLAKDAPSVYRMVYEHALTGHTLEELLRHHKVSSRQTTVALLELLDEDMLRPGPPLFTDYSYQVYHHYEDRTLFKMVDNLKTGLEELEFPLRFPTDDEDEEEAERDLSESAIMRKPLGPKRRRKRLPTAVANWQIPAPKVLVMGNRNDHVASLVESMELLHEAITHTTAARHRDLTGTVTSRFEYVDHHFLDAVQLPSVLDRGGLRWLDQHAKEIISVILITADQTSEEVEQNLRLLRQLWARFDGIYFLVVPRITNRHKVALFRFDCRVCGHYLSADMDRAGDAIQCPACQTSLQIPDCLDYMANSMYLPDDIPIMQARTNEPQQARDLLLMLFDNILATRDEDASPDPEWANETWAL